MFLIKGCKKHYHPNISKNLKIGTLYEYRKTENEEIADKEEGVLNFRVHFDGDVRLDPDWFNLVMGGGVVVAGNNVDNSMPKVEGSIDFHAERMKIVSFSSEELIVADSRVSIRRDSPDAYVFCMTMAETPSEAKGIFASYDSQWFIANDRIQEFSERLGGLVLEACIGATKEGQVKLPVGMTTEDIRVDVEHRKVNYISRDIHFNSGNLCSFDDLVSMLYDLCFIKPPEKYSKEKEYRFHFRVKCGDLSILPWVDSLYISADEVLELMEWPDM